MMPVSFDLAREGIRVYAGRLYNHDYLWFSSTDVSKTASTLPLIHNYALSYALSGFSYGIYWGHTPRYTEDLAEMPVYATPARCYLSPGLTRFTQNAVNSLSLRTDDAPRDRNSPSIGWRVVINPICPVRNESDASGFSFYAFVRANYCLPSVVRLGKKGCAVRLDWQEISRPVASYREESIRVSHAVNPLDVLGELVSYEPVAIPPHLILRSAEIRNDWFVLTGEHRIHVPRRFVPAARSVTGIRVSSAPFDSGALRD